MPSTKYKKKFWVLLTLFGVFTLVGLSVAVGYLVRYSGTSEKVCAQCHPDLISLWKQSSGHPAESTSCFECHSQRMTLLPENANVITHVRDQLVPPEYMADDELTSQRCLDCHADVLDWGYQVKKTVVQFNHRIHNTEGLECVECHRTAGHQYMTNGTNRPTIKECLNCHFRELNGPSKSQTCLNCHDVILAPGGTWIDISKNPDKTARKNENEDNGLMDHD